jgi:2-polyprenyl-3-methyl-5-hydroxy-6-metoxy-1,4-benzoquinol methylase
MAATTAPHPVELMSPTHFEAIYAEASGDATRVPWADQRPHPALVTWLNVIAPSLLRCGSRVCVVGCGLGDDARELMRRGYEVVAFDCSHTAVKWAQSLDPENQTAYVVADLFNLPPRWVHRFDLVVEINTLQSLLPEQREAAFCSMASLMSRRGHLLVICRAAEQPVSIDDGPPWALTCDELLTLATGAELRADTFDSFIDETDPDGPIPRIRATFVRA